MATPLGRLCADYEANCRADGCFVSTITDIATCEDAARILWWHERTSDKESYKKTVMTNSIRSSHTDNNFPRGCYLHLEMDVGASSGVKFNKAESGARNNDASQICKIECKNVKDHHYRLQVQII